MYIFFTYLFTADNIWYRAVVLEVGENEVKVIYADYGNTEMVPFSRILPIPKHLLQIQFQITRCTLTGRKNNFILDHKWSSVGLCTFRLLNLSFSILFLGKEHFPAVWPEEVQHTFQTLLSKGVLATVESFDGFANVLSLCLDTKSGRRQLTAVMLDALQDQTKVSLDQTKTNQDQTKTNQNQTKVSQDQTKTHLSSFSQMPEQTGSSAAVIPHSPQPKSMSVTQMGPEEAPSGTCQIISTEPVAWTPQLEKNTPAPSVPGW